MAEYLGPAIALLIGVIGIFYSKAGQRQELGRMGYLLLALVVSAGIVSVYGVYAAKRDAAIEAVRTGQEAATIAADLQRERRNSNTLRGLLLARAFSEPDHTVDGILLIELTGPEDLDWADSYSQFAPLIGPGIRNANLAFEIPDILEIDYTIIPSAYGSTIEASYYEYEPRICSLTYTGDFMPFEPAPGSPCERESGYVYNGLVEAIAPYRSFIIDLPNDQSFWKVYSRIEQHQRSQPIGSLVINGDSSLTAERVLREVQRLTASIKFFSPFGDGDECSSSLLLHLDLQPQIEGSVVTVIIAGVRDYELNFCEIVPI